MSVRSEIGPLTWGAPCQSLGNRSIDMGSPMSVVGKSYSDWKLFPGPRAKYYPHSVVGHRPKLIWYMVYEYIVYGSDSW